MDSGEFAETGMFAGLHREIGRMTSGLVFLHQRHFNSLDLCYMGGLLDDAAGGPGGAVLPLRQVGQGHGGVDLPPVRLVFALRLLLLRSPDATAATDDRRNAQTRAQERTKQRAGELEVKFSLNDSRGFDLSCKVTESPLTCHIYLIRGPWFLKAQEDRKVSFCSLGSMRIY